MVDIQFFTSQTNLKKKKKRRRSIFRQAAIFEEGN